MSAFRVVTLWCCVLVCAHAALYMLAVLVARVISFRQDLGGGREARFAFDALLPRLLGASATTIFGVIWIPTNTLPAWIVAHEYRHTEQERALGYIGYPLAIGVAFVRGGGHAGSPMEIDARNYSLAHRREFPDVYVHVPGTPT